MTDIREFLEFTKGYYYHICLIWCGASSNAKTSVMGSPIFEAKPVKLFTDLRLGFFYAGNRLVLTGW